jgi:quercetin dioxygenase-like cupin family protein
MIPDGINDAGRNAVTGTGRKPPVIRRIVTRHDENGKAIVWIDAAAPRVFCTDAMTAVAHLWATDATPADYRSQEDAGTRVRGTAPPPGGTAFALLDLEPGSALPPLHRTDTVDYVVCLWGEVEMHLDDSVVTLKAGDVMVQLGTRHAWVNRGPVPARLAFMMVDGTPKRPDSVSGSQNPSH